MAAQNFSVHEFSQDASTQNAVGFGRGGELFAQWEWMEVCPRQRRVVFHAGDDRLSTRTHLCSGGATTPTLVYHDCTSPTRCTTTDGKGSQEVTLHYFSSTKVPRVFTASATHVDDAGLYAVYDGQSVHMYPEFEPRHTHSWEAFLIIEVSLGPSRSRC